MTDDQQRARELLAQEYERDGITHVPDCIRREAMLTEMEHRAIRAITAALRAAPEGFVMVPVERGQFYVCPTCNGPGVVTKDVHDNVQAKPSIAPQFNPNANTFDEFNESLPVPVTYVTREQILKDIAARDGCTESNCKRCRTHPDHRGEMERAGIGWRPDSPQEASDA